MKKFYCQECGKEVPLEANKCPYCHKEFGSVLCPKCNYSSSSRNFVNGCPKCGYLSNPKIKSKNNLTLKIFISLFITLIVSIILLISIF